MGQKIILRFRNGSHAGASREFKANTITIGRDSSCEMAFDSDKDDLVSRQHAKITAELESASPFTISDLGSRNGTYVNGQRINGKMAISPGDMIQLGPGGPEFEFDLDPRPAAIRATRLASVMLSEAKTAPVPAGMRMASANASNSTPPSAKLSVGKQTVERMIAETKKASSRSIQRVIAIAAGLFIVVAGLLALPSVRAKLGFPVKSGLTPAEISSRAGESVVFFEVGWKLQDMETGRPLYQLYMDNQV
ncbi:MAG: FHA domain-containing protein, partial [Acidobacteriaceae bacterium]|nr:FHA domain-containing protein [Acidobacteriaceae bacterium]